MGEVIQLNQHSKDVIDKDHFQINNIKKSTATIDLTNLKPNHRVFEIDIPGQEIRPAIILETSVLLTNRKDYVEFELRKGCFYVPALNAQNAERRFMKNKKQFINGPVITA